MPSGQDLGLSLSLWGVTRKLVALVPGIAHLMQEDMVWSHSLKLSPGSFTEITIVIEIVIMPKFEGETCGRHSTCFLFLMPFQ